MDSTKKQPIFTRFGKACKIFLQKGTTLGVAPAAILSDTVATVDPILGAALAGLALFAGLSVGLLYRKLHDQERSLRHRAENAETELRALLTMTDDAVLLLDAQSNIRAANPAADELFGRDAEEFMGDALSSILSEQPNLAELTQQGPASFHAKAKRSDGTAPDVEVLISQIQLQKDTSYLALLHELVDRQTTPLPTIPARDLSAPLTKLCHDLNNHLTGVLGNVSLILMTGQNDPATQERALSAKRIALRAQDISHKLQALARGDTHDTPSAPSTPMTIVQMPPPPANKPRPRILVLDDDETICALLAAVLTPLGCDVIEATSTAAAFTACEESVRNNAPFTLVITDLSLSEPITGTEAVARMKRIDPQLRAIITTGHNADPVLLRYREHGFVGALSKPYEISKLEHLVFQLLTHPDDHLKTA